MPHSFAASLPQTTGARADTAFAPRVPRLCAPELLSISGPAQPGGEVVAPTPSKTMEQLSLNGAPRGVLHESLQKVST